MSNSGYRHAVPRARSMLMAVATGLALSLAGAAAIGSPGGPHGGKGGGSFDHMIGRMLAQAKDRLNLNTSQQTMFDNAVAQSKAAHEAARANRQQVKAAIDAELTKPEPNLAAIATVADNVEQQNRTQRLNVRSTWLQFYATLSPEQKTIVRDMLAARLQRSESFREKFRERFHGNRPPRGEGASQ